MSGTTAEPSGVAAKTESGDMGTRGGGPKTGVPQHGVTRARSDQDADDGARSGPGGGGEARALPSGAPVNPKRMAKHCPATLEAATCEALTKAAEKSRDGSHEAVATGDCTEVLTKAECEAIYAVRDQAAEAPDSILMSGAEFRECLQNLTPRCEKLLGPLLTRRRQFEESQQTR